jgi:hypothetical protein
MPLIRRPAAGSPGDIHRRQRAADDQLSESRRPWRATSRSLWTYCRMMNATSACPIRLLRAFQSILASRPAVLPAEQRAVIVVAGSELRTLAVQQLDMPGEDRQGPGAQVEQFAAGSGQFAPWSGPPKSHLPGWPFQVPDEAAHESVLRLYLEPVKPSPVRSDRVLLEPG